MTYKEEFQQMLQVSKLSDAYAGMSIENKIKFIVCAHKRYPGFVDALDDTVADLLKELKDSEDGYTKLKGISNGIKRAVEHHEKGDKYFEKMDYWSSFSFSLSYFSYH